jgi:hypothetical protein
MGNFDFYDGHAKPKKWLRPLYPLSENNWQADPPSQNPQSRGVASVPGCDHDVPASLDAREFQTKECLTYQ